MEIEIFLRPAEQGGRGGRCSGGAAAPPLAVSLVHIRSDVCLPVVILGVFNYFSNVWTRLPHITDRGLFQLTILIFNKKLNLLNGAS